MPRALICEKSGDPTLPVGHGVLKVVEGYELPVLKPGHVRVVVTAASVNYADPLCVKGEYQVKMPLPFVPGSEASGTVVECGKGVTRLRHGDKVVFFQQGGAFASEAVVHEAAVWKVPDGVDLATAAAVPITYGTADLALRHRANTQSGQTVLVLGAGGGVGVAAVQIAKVVGAKVIAVTQGSHKCDFLRQQGADVVIDTSSVTADAPLHKHIKAHAPKGVHVVIDPVGGQFFNEALKSVAWGANVVVIGFAAGGIPKIPANILLVKNTTVHGLFWGSYMQHNPSVLRSSMDDVMTWFAKGQLKPHVSHTFSIDEAHLAFKTMLDRKMMGKILLKPGLQSRM